MSKNKKVLIFPSKFGIMLVRNIRKVLKGYITVYYRHDLSYDYPERSDGHMLVLKRTREIKLDENYEYMPRGVMFRIKRALVATVLHFVVFPLTHLTHGLRIYGRKNILQDALAEKIL